MYSYPSSNSSPSAYHANGNWLQRRNQQTTNNYYSCGDELTAFTELECSSKHRDSRKQTTFQAGPTLSVSGFYAGVHKCIEWLQQKSSRQYKNIAYSSKRQQRQAFNKVLWIHRFLLVLLCLTFLYLLLFITREPEDGRQLATHLSSKTGSLYAGSLYFLPASEREEGQLHQRSRDLSCNQIKGLETVQGYDMLSVMETASLLMKQHKLFCNCAPLYNVSYRYLTIWDGWSTVHAFNPVITAPATSFGRVMVQETQEILFPGAGARERVRLNGLILSYQDDACMVQSARLFTHDAAWCIQSCVDLLEGKTIYEDEDV